MTAPSSRWLLWTACLGALAACHGSASGPDQTTGNVMCSPLDPVPRRLWRLSVQQYSNSVRDLLGLPAGPTLATTGGTSEYAFFSDDSASVDAQLAYNINAATQKILSDARAAVPAFAACATGEAEAACADRFARSFGMRAFRRPLDDGEVTALLAAYTEGRKQDFGTGISLMIQALLQSPSFLFRSELGAAPGATTLTPYEVASQISYTFLNSTPDQGLLDAAANNSLGTPQGIGREVDRLLTLDPVKQNVGRIVLDWFNVRQLYAKTKSTDFLAALPAADQDQAVLQDNLVNSAQQFIDDVLWSGSGKVVDLLTSPKLFVNQRLATLYGLPFGGSTPETFVAVDAPAGERAGMLTQPGVIWATSDPATTSLVHRGIFVHNDVICADPLPQPGGLLSQPDIMAKLAMLPTEIDKSDYRLMTPLCAGCHANIDPFGLILEGFDPVGRVRTVADGLPVKNTGDFSNSAPLTGQITGPVAFARAIIADKQLSGCAAQKMASYAIGRMIRVNATCEVQDVRAQFEKSDGKITTLLRQVAVAGFMRTRSGGAQ